MRMGGFRCLQEQECMHTAILFTRLLWGECACVHRGPYGLCAYALLANAGPGLNPAGPSYMNM